MNTFRKAVPMRLLHEIRVGGQVIRVERAPSGLNHYFIAGREVGVDAYLAHAGREHAERQSLLRMA